MSNRRWIFVGIALSALWAVTAGVGEYREIREGAVGFADLSARACLSQPQASDPTVAAACEGKRLQDEAKWVEDDGGYVKNVAATALVPIPLGWLAGYILLILARIWVTGFRTVVPWIAMTSGGRWITAGWLAVLGGSIVVAAVAQMNLVTDSRVPVSLGSPVMVIALDEDNLEVVGTWTRHGQRAGSEMGYPLQVSRIICERALWRCTEAMSSVAEAGPSGDTSTLLPPELTVHPVESWTDGVITYTDEDLCSAETYSINTKTRSVSGAGRATNADAQWCKAHPPTETAWTYQLVNGFDVYWKLRQANRPAALRVFQSLFGN